LKRHELFIINLEPPLPTFCQRFWMTSTLISLLITLNIHKETTCFSQTVHKDDHDASLVL